MAPEFFDALRTAGKTLIQYDSDWRARSGVPDKGLVSRFHMALAEGLWLLVCVDQLDPNHTMVGEWLVRWMVMLEATTAKDPKQPDWEGLEHMVVTKIRETGAVELPQFNAWLTGVQRDHAQIMKQGRLLREERAAEKKRQNQQKEEK